MQGRQENRLWFLNQGKSENRPAITKSKWCGIGKRTDQNLTRTPREKQTFFLIIELLWLRSIWYYNFQGSFRFPRVSEPQFTASTCQAKFYAVLFGSSVIRRWAWESLMLIHKINSPSSEIWHRYSGIKMVDSPGVQGFSVVRTWTVRHPQLC